MSLLTGEKLGQGERETCPPPPADFVLNKFVTAFEPGLVTGLHRPPDFSGLTSVIHEKLACWLLNIQWFYYLT